MKHESDDLFAAWLRASNVKNSDVAMKSLKYLFFFSSIKPWEYFGIATMQLWPLTSTFVHGLMLLTVEMFKKIWKWQNSILNFLSLGSHRETLVVALKNLKIHVSSLYFLYNVNCPFCLIHLTFCFLHQCQKLKFKDMTTVTKIINLKTTVKKQIKKSF